jgi:DNA-binding IclR family transcriptional regulator
MNSVHVMTEDAPDGEKSGKTQFGVQSVEIGLRVLAVLAKAYQPMMLRDLARTMGMPSAKVHRYLVSLAREGMVEQETAGGRYSLGPLALSVGLAALHQLDVVKICGAAAADLRDRTDLTVLLAIWGSAGPTIVRWEESRRPIAVNVRVGSVLTLLESATGLVFAAFLPRHVTEEKLAEEMRDHPDRDEVESLLAKVRARGIALVRGNQLTSINAISAPIFDHTGNLAAALTILGPERRFNVRWDSVEARDLKEIAGQLSERLGHSQKVGAGDTPMRAR